MDRVRTHRVLAALAVGYGVALVVLVAGPWGWALNRVTVAWYVFFRYDWPIAPEGALPEHYGIVLNVVLFVPLGALAVLLLRRPWWMVVLGAAAVSTAIELTQRLVLAREGTGLDVVANTAGAAIGAVIGAAIGAVVPTARRRRNGSQPVRRSSPPRRP